MRFSFSMLRSVGPTDGEVIFVEGKNVDRFASDLAADFNHSFVLVTHNSDVDVPIEGRPAERILLGINHKDGNVCIMPSLKAV